MANRCFQCFLLSDILIVQRERPDHFHKQMLWTFKTNVITLFASDQSQKEHCHAREMKTTREFKRHLVPLQSSVSGFTYSVTQRKWELRAWGEKENKQVVMTRGQGKDCTVTEKLTWLNFNLKGDLNAWPDGNLMICYGSSALVSWPQAAIINFSMSDSFTPRRILK